MKRVLFCLIFIYSSIFAYAQQIQPKAFFVQDTMALAEPVQFSLSVRYPSSLTLLFPDSSFNYYPFEFRSKKFFTTETDSTTSKDSVIYTLASFELDQYQSLKLPIFVIKGEDSISVLSNADSIVFAEMIPVVSDSLNAKANANYVAVEKEFNYPYLIIGLIVLAVVVLAVIIFFGKRIMLRWKIYRLKKKHSLFLESFKDFNDLSEKSSIEKKLVQWKKHAEFLSRKPFSKLTTKEINFMMNEDDLYVNLQKIDRSIYSSRGKEELVSSFEYLRNYATTIFDNIVKELEDHAKR
ncbi:hypothetical protein GCM10027429_26900 [Marivirga atlantica]|uniref:Oxygen tolerance n=1 Tax=Marivirga atlantica TaxID=1548457 RepID=A0A937DFJ8_9BACT|nr:hypothetical protein [Marivirga atlantica]MBL0766292.1 hypothetical protein [Marivirga atlantica]